jgi:hypothetical protein
MITVSVFEHCSCMPVQVARLLYLIPEIKEAPREAHTIFTSSTVLDANFTWSCGIKNI